MGELITAIGLLFFIEGLFLAIFPSRIKNMLELIKNTPENKLRSFGYLFFDYRFFNNLVYKKLMNFLKKIFFIFIVLNLTSLNAKPVPGSFADLAEKLMPSVVNISTTQTVKTTTNNFPFQFPPGSPFGEMFKDFERPTERKASSLGSGFIIKKIMELLLLIITLLQNAEDILVRVGDKEYKAEVVGADPYMDIAVLKMKTKEKFNTVKFGDSDKARVGDWAVAIGNPFGLRWNSYCRNYISQK